MLCTLCHPVDSMLVHCCNSICYLASPFCGKLGDLCDFALDPCQILFSLRSVGAKVPIGWGEVASSTALTTSPVRALSLTSNLQHQQILDEHHKLLKSLFFNFQNLKCKILDIHRTTKWQSLDTMTQQENIKSLPLTAISECLGQASWSPEAQTTG